MADGKARRFERAFKIAALERMAAGENVSALSRELGIRRKLLYQWRDTVRRGGIEALRGVAPFLPDRGDRRRGCRRARGCGAAGRAPRRQDRA
jgi:transposase